MFSWTLVSVRLRGRFCFTREVRVGLLNIRRCATKTTCRSENFFSSSLVSLQYTAISQLDRIDAGLSAPCLDLPKRLQLRHRHEDHDGLLSAADIDFARCRDLEGAELGLELRDVVFEIDERLGDAELGLIRGGGGRVGRAEDLGRHSG